jgi:pimeloyl-ACP methyl ester carboxylesterase
MRTARRRLSAVVAVVAAVTLGLSGCVYSAIPAESAPGVTREPDVEGVDAELLPFYSQEISWAACDTGFECATVTAPLDWNDVTAGEIDLAIVRHVATGADPVGSLLTNPGGPGSSGVSFVKENLEYAYGGPLQESFDIVGFDPRGVGESTAVTCYDATDMDAYLYDLPQHERGSAEWEADRIEANAAFAEACDANSDGLLPYVTTEFAARDLDLLRAVLGDRELYYLGYSYGTFLGAMYAKLYPERVGRLVLDAAVDPSVSGLQNGVTQAIGFENALRAYVEYCLSQEGCPLSGTVDDAMGDIGTLLASVDRTALEGSDGRMLGADTLLTAIVLPLYNESSWPALTDVLTAALQGQADYPLFVADLYNDRDEGGGYASNQSEAFRAYNCMDYPLDTSDADNDAAEQRIREEAPTIAPYWIGPDPCADWPYAATGVREPITAAGAAPILVVGTTNDPATPYEWAVSLADQLESGVLVTREGEGHAGYLRGNECVDTVVEDYLVDGVVPDADVSC